MVPPGVRNGEQIDPDLVHVVDYDVPAGNDTEVGSAGYGVSARGQRAIPAWCRRASGGVPCVG